MKVRKRPADSKLLRASMLGALLSPACVYAADFSTDELRFTLDTTLTYGAAWRTASPSPANIGISNGGTAESVNSDDGDMNFKRGQLVSSVMRATHELELKYHNYGLFARGTYAFDSVNDRAPVTTNSDAGKKVGRDARLLDLYASGQWTVNGRDLSVRVGQQVVNWGEGLFIQNGIGVVNPFDVSKLHSPGSELREAYIPTPMLWLSQQVSEHASVEALYLTRADHYRLDPRGTFFSNDDAITGNTGADRIYLSPVLPDQHGDPNADSFLAGGPGNAWLRRGPDQKTSNNGQFGLAYRYALEGGAELGLFHLNYHSRIPLVQFRAGSPSFYAAAAGGNVDGDASYSVVYPEHIKLWGVSLSAKGPLGLSLAGEYSYRPNQPVQIATTELTKAAISAASYALTGATLPNTITGSAPDQVAMPGTDLQSYRDVKMHQLQGSAIKVFSGGLGATQTMLIVEAGFTYLALPDGVLFDGPATYNGAPGTAGDRQPVQTTGYLTRRSWGYTMAYSMDYTDIYRGATLSPHFSFSHDVKGVGPTFNQGSKALGVGATLVSQDHKWKADLSYTTYYGGRVYSGIDLASGGIPYSSNANYLKDRDFIAASVSYSF